MTSKIFLNLLDLFLVSVQCSEDNNDASNFANTSEGLKVLNNPLSFSFSRTDYSDFECNFNQEILTHERLMRPPFYHSISTGNFFSVFSYIFQYSRIISDENFKKTIESLFKCYLEKVHALKNSSAKLCYNSNDFKRHLVKMENKISEIISNRDFNNQFVNVEEREDRIIITPKESSKLCQLKFVEEFVKDLPPVESDSKINEAMNEFYIKFNEMYLQDQSNVGYLDFLSLLIIIVETKKNVEMCRKVEKVTEFCGPNAELLKQINNIFDMMVKEKNSTPETSTKYAEKKIEREIVLSFAKYSRIYARKHISGELPTYLVDLISKVKTKILLALSEESKSYDMFVGNKKEYIDSLFSLKSMLFETFKDPKNINYGSKKLSNESIESLVKNCLDMDI